MDTAARCLLIDISSCWDPVICQADVDAFDMSAYSVMVNLYFSYTLVHEDPTTPDFELKKRIIRVLIKNIVARLTHFFGQIWVIQRGGVPSGCFDTSHMDSWIMLMYFCLFCVYQTITAPIEHRVDLERQFILMIRIMVYGDDHNWNKGKLGSLAYTYFGCEQFAKFMFDKFGVVLRDRRDGIPFCSTHANGWLIKPGSVFLKHYAVLNRNKRIGQSVFLPYRETREYFARAIWGRVPKLRDLLDILLSVLGHVYGTHGSNYDAYKSLKFLYEALLRRIPRGIETIGDALDRFDRTDIKKLRQHGISVDDIKSGFPNWDNLQSRNIYDAEYQNTTRGIDEEMSEWDGAW